MAAPEARLHEQLSKLMIGVDRTLSISSDIDGECLQLLQKAAGLLRSAHGLAGKRLAKVRAGAANVPMIGAPPPSPAPAKLAPSGESDLDKEEREEREMAARRAQFALGAGEDDEDIDWGDYTGAEGGSDDEGAYGDGDGDDAAIAAAAARVLEGLEDNGTEDASAPVRGWETEADFVAQGADGFNEYARSKMREAGVPANDRVLPPQNLAAAEWAAQPTKPKLQCYQETVAFLCRPQVRQSSTQPRAQCTARKAHGACCRRGV